MRTIQTVLGPIAPEDLGQTLMHEHLSMADWSMRAAFGDKWFNESLLLPHSVKQVNKAKEVGIKTIVEGTPVNAGRDVPFMQKVSQETGVNIIASTGLYNNHESWLACRDFGDVYDLLIDECKNGMQGTSARPGIVKAATNHTGVDPYHKRLLDMLGHVAAEADLSIQIHHESHTLCGTEIIKVLEEAGVKPQHILILHAADSDDRGYMRELLQEGVFIGNDRLGYELSGSTIKERIDSTLALVEEGYIKQIILSHDLGVFMGLFEGQDATIKREHIWENGIGYEFNAVRPGDYPDGGTDYNYITSYIVPQFLSAGLTKDDIVCLMERNPLALLTNE